MPQNPSPSEYLNLGTAPADLVQAARDEGDIGVEKWLRAQSLDALELAKEKRYVRLQNFYHLAVLEEEIQKKRHKELSVHLKELRKHHWTQAPTFWLVLAGTIIASLALVIAFLAWKEPVEPQFDLNAQQVQPRRPSSPILPIPPDKSTPQVSAQPKPVPALTNSTAAPVSPKK